MIRKRFTATFLIATIFMACLSFNGCGKKDPKNTTDNPETPTVTVTAEVTPTVTEPVVTQPVKESVFVPGYEAHGFKVVKTDEVVGVNGKIIHMEHEKSGAQLVYAECNDAERTFGVAFRTPAENDKGIPHILEHCCVNGSSKYPDSSLTRKLLYQSYTSYMNAFTGVGYTYYPIASYSEEQLFSLMDVYMNGVLHPLVLQNENIFMREGFHFELDNRNAQIEAKGIVFNEERENIATESDMSDYYWLRKMFPNSTKTYCYGGVPSEMLSVTYEEVVAFHERYYHPSNMLLWLYGDFEDVDRFLAQLDSEYLSQYEKKDIDFPEESLEVAEGFIEVPIPVYYTSKISLDTTFVEYSFTWNDNKPETVRLAKMLAEQMNETTSEFYKRVTGVYDLTSLAVYVSDVYPLPVMTIMASGLDTDRVDSFAKYMQEILGDLEDGLIDENRIMYYLNAERFQQAVSEETYNNGVQLFDIIAAGWGVYGNGDALEEYDAAMEYIREAVENNKIEKIVSSHVLNPKTVVYAYNVPTLVQETKSTMLCTSDDWQAYKKNMTNAELDEVIEKTKTYREWASQEDNDDSVMEQLKVIDIQDLPEDFPKPAVKDQTVDGTRYITSEVPETEAFLFQMLIDVNSIPFESIYDLNLYASMLGNVTTRHYSQKELMAYRNTKLTEVDFSVIHKQFEGKEPHLYLEVDAVGLNDQLEDTMAYIKEVLLYSLVEDNAVVYNQTMENYSYFYGMLYSNPQKLLVDSGKASVSENLFLEYQFHDSMDYYSYMYKILTQDSEVLANKGNKLNSIKSIVLHSPGTIVEVAGTAESIKTCEAAVKDILGEMSSDSVKQQNYLGYYKNWKKSTGFSVSLVDSIYNMEVLNLADTKFDPYDGKLQLVTHIVGDSILMNQIREKNNAYMTDAAISDGCLLVCSGRDPYVKETYAVFDSIGDQLREMEFTQEQIDYYILSFYSMNIPYTSPLLSALDAMEAKLTGVDPDANEKLLHDIKSMTPEDIKTYAEVFDLLSESGNKITIGNRDVINDNKDLFEKVINY